MDDFAQGFARLLPFIIGGVIYFLITAGAVKIGVKEALYEVKEDLIKEFNLRDNSKNDK